MANGHGGKREGAGRKPKAPVLVRKVFADELLNNPDEEKKLWLSLLYSKDERIRLDALRYVSERKYGKAPMSIGIGGVNEDGEVVPSDTPLVNVVFVSAEHKKQPEEPHTTIEATLTEPQENVLPVSGKKPNDPALAKAVKEAARTAQRKAETTETPVSTPPEPEPPPGFIFWPESKIKQHEFHRWKIPANVLPMPRKR